MSASSTENLIAALGTAALQLLALSVALLLGLFTIRQEQILIRRATYLRIMFLFVLLVLTALAWLAYSGAALWFYTGREALQRASLFVATTEILTTAGYLVLLAYSVWELFGYLRKLERS